MIGLLSGVAGGKSTVASMLAARGWHVLDADRIAHEVLEEPEIRMALVEAFGLSVLGSDGTVDRRGLARRVFRDLEAKRRLEAITPPRILEILREELERALEGQAPIALDVPLLLERGLAGRCDHLLFIDTPAELRRRRAAERGIPPEDWAAREAMQAPLEEKRKRADAVVDNSGDRARTELSLDAALRTLGLTGPESGPTGTQPGPAGGPSNPRRDRSG